MGEPGNQVPRKYFDMQKVFRVLEGRNAATDNIGGKLRSSLVNGKGNFCRKVKSAACSIKRVQTFCIYLRFHDLQ